ncbi:MAG: hypothetical protein FWF38_03195 [Spirochaetaceae bacterium]|nr:hypothetical protein [Spirochaetaceae bacterium]
MKRILICTLIYILAGSAFFALPVVKEKLVTAAPVEGKKFPLEGKDVLAAMLWPLMMITGCPSTSTTDDPPPPITVTKDVAVSFPVYTSGQTSISFAPTYTPDDGWGDHFSASDITYTVTCTELSKTYNSTTGFIANISDGYSFDTYTFIQTFKIGDAEVGSQTIKVDVTITFQQLQDANGFNLSPQAIPPVSLTLSKEVQQ